MDVSPQEECDLGAAIVQGVFDAGREGGHRDDLRADGRPFADLSPVYLTDGPWWSEDERLGQERQVGGAGDVRVGRGQIPR